MTVELWMGQEHAHSQQCGHAHEMRALGRFLSAMVETYGADDQLYLVMANFFCDGNQDRPGGLQEQRHCCSSS